NGGDSGPLAGFGLASAGFNNGLGPVGGAFRPPGGGLGFVSPTGGSVSSFTGAGSKLPARGPPHGPPVQDPRKAQLIAGAFVDQGQYKPTQDGFANADLDALLQAYGAYWNVSTTDPSGGQGFVIPSPNGGHSAGKNVDEHPAWV